MNIIQNRDMLYYEYYGFRCSHLNSWQALLHHSRISLYQCFFAKNKQCKQCKWLTTLSCAPGLNYHIFPMFDIMWRLNTGKYLANNMTLYHTYWNQVSTHQYIGVSFFLLPHVLNGWADLLVKEGLYYYRTKRYQPFVKRGHGESYW